jgi:hypothetical protein
MRRLLVATDRVDMPTEPGTPQHHVGDDRTDSEQPDRQREAQDAALTEGVESGCQTGDRATVGVDEGQTPGGRHHAQGGDERRDVELGDEEAVPVTSS